MQAENRENSAIKESWSVIHPISPEDSAAMATLRSAVEAMKGKLEGVAARAPFNSIIEHVASPDGVAFEADSVWGIWILNCFEILTSRPVDHRGGFDDGNLGFPASPDRGEHAQRKRSAGLNFGRLAERWSTPN
jgi:hypothetical protein